MAELASTAAERCTSILLAAFMDYLSLSDILCSMAVNRFWRDHAINHRTYYGDPLLMQQVPPSKSNNIDCFLLRLTRSAGRPVSVWLELDNPNSPILIEALTEHLHHMTTLTLRQSPGQSLSPILAALCRPAPLLRRLYVEYAPHRVRVVDSQPTPPTPWHPTFSTALLPLEFLGGQAPALEDVSLSDIDLPLEMPCCLSSISSLAFSASGQDRATRLVLPNPFTRCPNLRILRLSGFIALDPATFLARMGWERMTNVSFSYCGLEDQWQSLPIANIPEIDVYGANAENSVALVETISGALELTFEAPHRYHSFGRDHVHYNASWSSVSVPAITRAFTGDLCVDESAAMFGMPSLADRVVRLVLSVTGWDDIIGFSAFGPFDALEELVLEVYWHNELFEPPSLVLPCPRLKLLVGRVWQPGVQLTADVGRLARFARAALSPEVFPLKLELDGFIVKGPCDDLPDTFSSCVFRSTCVFP